MLRFRLFISSPSDVGPERALALSVAERLGFEFRGRIELETYLWERSLLRATASFQEQIADIKEVDLAVFILWSRIGTPLPPDQFVRPDGTSYTSGTEYEFEQANAAHQEKKSPEILFYLKTADVQLSLKDRDRRAQRVDDIEAINAFTDKWFRNADGTFKSAFYNFDRTAQFEELFEVHLRHWIREKLTSTGAISAAQPVWEGSPFRGLKQFDFEHALIYCGRTALISELIETLRRRGAAGHGFLMVTGMSGVGKSSLIRAGVLPMLTRPRVIEPVSIWRRAVFRSKVSGEKLIPGFAASLLHPDALPELKDDPRPVLKLLEDPAALASSLIQALGRATNEQRRRSAAGEREGEVGLIILCDQFEEIFDETITSEERTMFVEAIRGAVTTGRVWVIATLRADYFARCAELPERFRDLFIGADGIFTVGGPRPAEMAQMIRLPAAIAGIQFERHKGGDEGLDDLLLNDAAGNPTVLPLLEFTLEELWRRSLAAGTPVLRFADYKDLGGLHGALKLRANEVFDGLNADVQSSLPEVLAALVRTDATDEKMILQSRVPLDRFDKSLNARKLIDAFVAAHLFVADKAPNGTPVIGLAHEALLREWPPAAGWIEQNRELLGLRSGIAASAAFWRAGGAEEHRLLSGALLRDAEKILQTNPAILPPEEMRFVQLSIAENRRRRKRSTVIGAFAGCLIALAIAGSIMGLNRIEYDLSFARAMPTAWQSGQDLSLPQTTRATLESNINALADFLTPLAARRKEHPELTAWSLAEMWAALHDVKPGLVDGPSLREAATATRDPHCHCWPETADKLPHMMSTAWIHYALALYDQPATREEIDWLLKQQGPSGWWPMFPSTRDDKNGSAAATAFVTLALHEQRAHELISPEQSPAVDQAIDRAVAWLLRDGDASTARWTPYPPGTTFEQGPIPAISALAMHALRVVKGIDKFDAPWLNNLPLAVPAPGKNDSAKAFVYLPGQASTQITLDDVRHYAFPWMVRETVDAYARGNLFARTRALLWLDEAIKTPARPADLNSEVWTSSEVLFALQHTKSMLAQKAGPRAATR
jgi:hypothetical protein